jgi:hypothetical protein
MRSAPKLFLISVTALCLGTHTLIAAAVLLAPGHEITLQIEQVFPPATEITTIGWAVLAAYLIGCLLLVSIGKKRRQL